MIRENEHWHFNNLMNNDPSDHSYVIDAQWMETWMSFIKRRYLFYYVTYRGKRPWHDVNKYMFVEYENDRVVFLNKKKCYTISDYLWNFVRDIYESRYALIRK